MTGKNCTPLKTTDGSWLMPEQTLARRWGKSVRTLQRWRTNGYGPPYISLGGSVRYRFCDVLAFEARMRRGGGDGQ